MAIETYKPGRIPSVQLKQVAGVPRKRYTKFPVVRVYYNVFSLTRKAVKFTQDDGYQYVLITVDKENKEVFLNFHKEYVPNCVAITWRYDTNGIRIAAQNLIQELKIVHRSVFNAKVSLSGAIVSFCYDPDEELSGIIKDPTLFEVAPPKPIKCRKCGDDVVDGICQTAICPTNYKQNINPTTLKRIEELCHDDTPCSEVVKIIGDMLQLHCYVGYSKCWGILKEDAGE